MPAMFAVTLVTGLGLGGAGVAYWINQQGADTGPVIPTSVSKEFQTNSGTGLKTVPTDPSFSPSRTGPSENELALQQRVAELERILQDARNAAPQEPEIDTEQLADLQVQLDGLKSELDAQSTETQAIAAERDGLQRDLSRSEAELSGLLMRLDQAEDDSMAEQLRQEEEASRRAELERRRAEAAELRTRQINSPIAGITGSGGNTTERDYEGDEAFLRRGAQTVRATQSRVLSAPSNTITQGTIIEATLTTGINSQLSGTLTSTVSFDIWAFDMSRVLIPRGSQLFGRYSNEIALGQRRVLVAWDRIVTPDAQVVDIDAYGSDRLGRSGLTGKVNSRFGQRFGAAALISVIGALPVIAAAGTGSETASDVAVNVSEDAADSVNSIVAQYLELAPIITVEHGDIIMVMVTNDLEMF